MRQFFPLVSCSVGNRGVANRDDGKKSAGKQQRSSTHRFLHSWSGDWCQPNFRPRGVLRQRQADRGMPIEAFRWPCKHPSFQVPRKVSFPAVNVPAPFGFPLSKFTLIPQFLQRQYAVAVRLTVCKLPFVASAGPGLRTLAGLTAIAPLAFVGLDGHAALRPLHGPAALRAAVCTGTRPGYQFVELRIRIPHATAGFVCDPLSGASRRRCGDQAGRQRRCRNAARDGVIKTKPVMGCTFIQCGSSGTTIPLSSSSRTSMKRSRTLPSASMTQVIGTPFGVPKPSSLMAFDSAVG